MQHRQSLNTCRAVLALTCWALSPTMGLAQEASVWDGVYTKVQAESGKRLFTTHCIACHSDEPGGVSGHGPAPSVIGKDFNFRWVDTSIADLFDVIRQTMPQAAPNSLSSQEYADITAYLLQINAFPTGSALLDPSDRERMLQTYIDATPPKG
ncbi:MAG: cytochrome c [Proteobacteria bacterium]|nr:cytochrome c [Pseudomonadota bacterium]